MKRGWKIPKGGLVGKLYHGVRAVQALRVPFYAAYAAYFIVLALFPGLLLLLSLVRYTEFSLEQLTLLLEDFVPRALVDGAEELMLSAYAGSSGAMVGISAVTALWSASAGIYGVLRGLNGVYGVEEDRGYLYTRGISVVYTFAFLLVLLVTLVLHVFGNTIISWLRMVDNDVVIFLVDLIDLRFVFLLVLQSLIFTLMFMVLPNHRNTFLRSLPGGVVSSLGWLVFSDLFSIYVEHFYRYSNIYGSVCALALGLLWLYCCMSILLYGGALNRLLAEH